MVIAYVVLDGFDLGAGIISLFVARTHDERHLILRAIGPVWDGNEVWLVAAAGALFFAFPPLYAALQRFLFAVDDRSLAPNAARYRRRAPLPR
jgi:cytochrome bd-type quinol oxidase subunit 2